MAVDSETLLGEENEPSFEQERIVFGSREIKWEEKSILLQRWSWKHETEFRHFIESEKELFYYSSKKEEGMLVNHLLPN